MSALAFRPLPTLRLLPSYRPPTSAGCIGGGCPGSGGGSHIGPILLGLLLVAVAVGLFIVARRRDRRERAGAPEPRAASLTVTLIRAGALLAALIGIAVLVIR